jgi:metal-sulfur cluster biosynthetic enzyme
MELSEDSVRESLKQVIDPELFVNIVDLGLIYVVTIEPTAEGPTNLGIEMTMTSPACPAGPQLVSQSRDVLSRLEGVGQVDEDGRQGCRGVIVQKPRNRVLGQSCRLGDDNRMPASADEHHRPLRGMGLRAGLGIRREH